MELKKEDYYVIALVVLCIVMMFQIIAITNSYNNLIEYVKSNYDLVPKENSMINMGFNLPPELQNINITIDEGIDNVNGWMF